MKKAMKKGASFVCAVVMLLTSGVGASAVEVSQPHGQNDGVAIAAAGTGDNDTMADTIVWRYKTENGKTYKRRWNATKSVWVDPAWILVG